jgi:hypothetical protein
VSDTMSAGDHVRDVRTHPWVKTVARTGYILVGVLHLIIGWLALRIAFGSGSGEEEEADQQGALQAISEQPFGTFLLWLAAASLVALALWQLSGAVVGAAEKDGWDKWKWRGRALGKAGVHSVLAFTTLSVIGGSQESGDEQAEEASGVLMGSTPGRVLLFAIGVGIIGFAGYQVWIGLSRRFLVVLRDDMHDAFEPVVIKTGMVGYPARGLALGVSGFLACYAAVITDPEEVGGIDEALTTLAEQPWGPVALVIIALGFISFGLFSFGRARYGHI